MGRRGRTRLGPTHRSLPLTYRMKVPLILLGCLLCLRLSAGFSRGAHVAIGSVRGRNPYSGGRSYGRGYLQEGGRQMGGMGFGKRAQDYYSPEEEQDTEYEYEDVDIPSTLRYLQQLEDYARIMEQEKEDDEKRGGMASLARMKSDAGMEAKRGMASLARIDSYTNPENKRGLSSLRGLNGKRGLSSLRGLNGKRGSNSPLAILGSRGKRGALSSLRSQGFTKYNI